ncbi:lipopolysaccharide heptosyltransferase II [Marinospirillum minutulum]|uniref:lipopolysaccharide heptosyltransferase II n=1 Tax=Marinospirillum minutulum TaxID=64974 RepID=UPI001FDFD10B|nr:lipopolysaccharide heptosyltransferase II [Marinospirillum minutulum]
MRKKILVVGPSWVGDMVMAQSLFKLLRFRFSGCRIHVLAPAWSEPILSRMPEVTKTLVLPFGHGHWGMVERWKLGRSLVNEEYSQAIVLPRSWKSALVPFAAKIPLRTGFLGEQRYGLLNDHRPLDKKLLDQTVKRYTSLGLSAIEEFTSDLVSFPKLEVDSLNQQSLFQSLGLNSNPVVALMPGAEYGTAKQWPLSYFRVLAEKLVASGMQVLVLGGPKDAAAGAEIAASGLSDLHNLCGKTQLADVVDLLAASQAAVTNDSGLMHVAAAVGTKVHAIYGSSSPAFTPPLTVNSQIYYLNLDCSPCFKRTCPLGHTNCLNNILVEQVLSSIN